MQNNPLFYKSNFGKQNNQTNKGKRRLLCKKKVRKKNKY